MFFIHGAKGQQKFFAVALYCTLNGYYKNTAT